MNRIPPLTNTTVTNAPATNAPANSPANAQVGKTAQQTPAPSVRPLLLTIDQISPGMKLTTAGGKAVDGPLEVGELLVVVSVMAAHVVNDIRENIRNLVGGRMNHYEKLVENAVQAALEAIGRKALEQGYDGVIGLKISHPSLVEGGVEVVVYGNGFRMGNNDSN